LNHPKSVIARFMRATQFVFPKRKMGCPDKPGNDDLGVNKFNAKTLMRRT
jgi:hypothetical protein